MRYLKKDPNWIICQEQQHQIPQSLVSPQLTPARASSLFENAMGNPFFDFFKYWPKRSKKKFRIEIWTFSFQICFLNQFLTLESRQTENMQIRVFAYFQFDNFPKSKIDSQSRFEMRMSIFLFKKNFVKRFCQYLKKSKKGFPIVFSKSDVALAGVNCRYRLWVL